VKTGCSLIVLFAASCCAATRLVCPQDPITYKKWVDHGEPYSLAACAGSDPKEHFEEMKIDLEMATIDIIKLKLLGAVAKAALEAGLNDEAELYADQALALAAEGRFSKAPPVTFESDAEGEAVFLGNLVLGRLALLRDDVQAAETYLLLSGKIKAGSQTFWGPNMTLARELLKRNRTKVVLEFLEEVKEFWLEECAFGKPEEWEKAIRAGKMPTDLILTYY